MGVEGSKVMIRQSPAWRAILLLTIGCLSLAGCFDIAERLTLNSSGGGQLTVQAVVLRELSGHFSLDQAGQPPPIFGDNKNATQNMAMKDGRLVLDAAVTFRSLNEVPLGTDRIEVVDLGRTLLGATRNRVTWRIGTDGRVPAKQDMHDIAAFFAGRTLEIAMDLPCNVEGAATTRLAAVAIVPTIGPSASGTTVRWKIPLDVLLTAPAQPRSFSVVCWSWLGIPASVTSAAPIPGASILRGDR